MTNARRTVCGLAFAGLTLLSTQGAKASPGIQGMIQAETHEAGLATFGKTPGQKAVYERSEMQTNLGVAALGAVALGGLSLLERAQRRRTAGVTR